MDKSQIITIVITVLVTGIIAPFSKSFFDKTFAVYNPDPKKINNSLKRVFLYISRYCLPFGNLVYVYWTYDKVDKFFVFNIAFTLSALSIIIIYDALLVFIDNSKMQSENISQIISLLEKNSHFDYKVLDVIEQLTEVQKNHVEATKKVIKENATIGSSSKK